MNKSTAIENKNNLKERMTIFHNNLKKPRHEHNAGLYHEFNKYFPNDVTDLIFETITNMKNPGKIDEYHLGVFNLYDKSNDILFTLYGLCKSKNNEKAKRIIEFILNDHKCVNPIDFDIQELKKTAQGGRHNGNAGDSKSINNFNIYDMFERRKIKKKSHNICCEIMRIIYKICLCQASKGGNIELYEYLIEKFKHPCLDISIKSAFLGGQIEMVKYLIKNNYTLDLNKYSYDIGMCKNLQMLDFIENNFNDYSIKEIFLGACHNGYLPIIKWCLSRYGYSLIYYGLELSCVFNKFDVFVYLFNYLKDYESNLLSNIIINDRKAIKSDNKSTKTCNINGTVNEDFSINGIGIVDNVTNERVNGNDINENFKQSSSENKFENTYYKQENIDIEDGLLIIDNYEILPGSEFLLKYFNCSNNTFINKIKYYITNRFNNDRLIELDYNMYIHLSNSFDYLLTESTEISLQKYNILIHNACKYNSEEIVKFILNNIEQIDIKSSFLIACIKNNINIVDILIESGKPHNFELGFVESCKHNSLDVFQYLLNNFNLSISTKNLGFKSAKVHNNDDICRIMKKGLHTTSY